MEDNRMTINGNEYEVVRLLGKGKGGYSYLVTDGHSRYVLKQIHHVNITHLEINSSQNSMIMKH